MILTALINPVGFIFALPRWVAAALAAAIPCTKFDISIPRIALGPVCGGIYPSPFYLKFYLIPINCKRKGED
jgi:hypothetical protein